MLSDMIERLRLLPRPRRTPVFTADFASPTQWIAGHSWAYPDGGPVNPGDNKLDHLTEDPAYSRAGVFRATPRPDGDWDCGLLTTEGSDEGFELRTGDVLEARVKLPVQIGAWPAIWTWRDGGQEIDVFEYHPDNPDLLELSNHVRAAHRYHRDPAVRPGAWIDLKVEFGRVRSSGGSTATASSATAGEWAAAGPRTSSSTSRSARAGTTRLRSPGSRSCPTRSRS